MTDKSRLDRVYAQLMRHHPYGWALYKKVTKREIFPGSCGYFDPEGDWQTIVDLTGPSHNLVGQGWKVPCDKIHSTRSPESTTWGPKNSGSIESRSVGGTVGATVAVAPVKASVTMLFENKSEQGAVLTTESPVLRHDIGDERSALQWMIDNKSEILRQHGDVLKRHGIWIVTKTYSTRRCGIAIMTTRSSTVEIGLEADVQGVLTLTPKNSWTNSTGSSCMELHEDDKDGVVVFISGIYFSKKLFSSGIRPARGQEEQKDKMFRGDEDEDVSGLNDGGGEGSELDIEFYPPLDEEQDNDDDDDDDDDDDEDCED
ncbi:hypothetical protein PT974_01526 [Cladobotryum mycophilum]|uniref:Uncharacterized protein n=1 Tax=Cladobotryum mycophilum TaxID=491253 RepID=A0ABR0T4V8_9HYPO